MSVYIGSLQFDESLKWLRAPDKAIGSDTEASDGSIVSITVVGPSQTEKLCKLSFNWIPWSSVEVLLAMAAARTTFTMKPEDEVSTTYTIRFAAENAVTDYEHEAFGRVNPSAVESYATDLWKGSINVIITSG